MPNLQQLKTPKPKLKILVEESQKINQALDKLVQHKETHQIYIFERYWELDNMVTLRHRESGESLEMDADSFRADFFQSIQF